MAERKEQPAEKDHLCFVINSIVPYCYDFTQILALPTGFRFRNRFREVWVDPNLRGSIESLEGQKVLLILRVRKTNTLIPIRWARLTKAERIGYVFYFEYALGDLILYDNHEDTRVSQITSFNESFATYNPAVSGKPDQDMSPCVFRSSIGTVTKSVDDTDLAAWGNIVSNLKGIDELKDVEFLKLVSITSRKDDYAVVRGGHFLLRPNIVYTIRVFQLVPNESLTIPPHDIELRAFPKDVSVLQGRQRAVGKYDMLKFVFQITNQQVKQQTYLEIVYDPVLSEDKKRYAYDSIHIPVLIRRYPWYQKLAYLILFAVSMVLIFKPTLLESVKLDKESVRSLATVLLIVLLTGARGFLNAIWPQFPKLQ